MKVLLNSYALYTTVTGWEVPLRYWVFGPLDLRDVCFLANFQSRSAKFFLDQLQTFGMHSWGSGIPSQLLGIRIMDHITSHPLYNTAPKVWACWAFPGSS